MIGKNERGQARLNLWGGGGGLRGWSLHFRSSSSPPTSFRLLNYLLLFIFLPFCLYFRCYLGFSIIIIFLVLYFVLFFLLRHLWLFYILLLSYIHLPSLLFISVFPVIKHFKTVKAHTNSSNSRCSCKQGWFTMLKHLHMKLKCFKNDTRWGLKVKKLSLLLR